MSLELICGAPGSGRTELLLERARALTRAGRRVLWIGLPTQRDHVLQRLAAGGAVTGFEFISEQQLCYRLLSRARQLRPLLVGTERLALVGAALAEHRQQVPLPGEARLYSAGIAELKRHGLNPDRARQLATDPESAQLAEVWTVFEELKGDAWDYDDYRSGALQLAEAGQADPGADALIVAGFRELLPATLRLMQALAASCAVTVALPEVPEELAAAGPAVTELPAPAPAARTVWRAPNEIEEIRWVLRDVKRELAAGTPMASMAVVAPADQLRMYEALAEEYGLPLRSEEPRTLADTVPGRVLLELIQLHDYAGPSALLALPGLAELAAAALSQRVSGEAALLELARQLDARAQDEEPDAESGPGFEVKLQEWLGRLAAGSGPDWADALIRLVADELMADSEVEQQELQRFRDQARQRAAEAARLGSGPSFRAWWAALLQDTLLPASGPAGIALLTPRLTSGRRYRHAWLTGATEGAYLPAGSEDWFIPEEQRSYDCRFGLLPRRFTGQEQLVLLEQLQLADELTVTWAESSQSGRNTPQPELTAGVDAGLLPDQPAGNSAELGAGASPQLDHQLDPAAVSLPQPEAQWLRSYQLCPHRAWATDLLQRSGDRASGFKPEWQRLRSELLRSGQLSAADLELLSLRFPWAAGWLDEWSGLLSGLRLGFRWPRGEGLHARVDAMGRPDGTVAIYRFSAPDPDLGPEGATALLRARTAERWLANYLLDARQRPEPLVRLFVWPVGGAPVEAGAPGGQDLNQRWLRNGLATLDEALELHALGSVAPRPDWSYCRGCPVYDFCRRGAPR